MIYSRKNLRIMFSWAWILSAISKIIFYLWLVDLPSGHTYGTLNYFSDSLLRCEGKENSHLWCWFWVRPTSARGTTRASTNFPSSMIRTSDTLCGAASPTSARTTSRAAKDEFASKSVFLCKWGSPGLILNSARLILFEHEAFNYLILILSRVYRSL